MLKTHIEARHLEIVKTILKKHLDETTLVWIFGSRANGELKKFSDLDIALQKADCTLVDFKKIINLTADFQDSALPWRVDIIDYNKISGVFKKNIDENKVLLNF